MEERNMKLLKSFQGGLLKKSACFEVSESSSEMRIRILFNLPDSVFTLCGDPTSGQPLPSLEILPKYSHNSLAFPLKQLVVCN